MDRKYCEIKLKKVQHTQTVHVHETLITMGVQRLTSFAKGQNHPKIYNQINILEEIRLWRK